MSATAHTAPPAPSSLRMVAVMGTVGLIASVLLVATYQLTLPYVEANRAAALEAAIYDVLPGAEQRQAFVVAGEALVPAAEAPEGAGPAVHAGYDAGGQLVGVAIEASGQGFQDVLRILYGYVPDCACVVGMKVLESKETPGLGDKIETDPAFRANFEALDVQLAPDGTRLLHEIGIVKQGTPREDWEIAAITGATISSEAIAAILGASTSEVLPVLHQQLDVLRAGAPGEVPTGDAPTDDAPTGDAPTTN